MSRPFPFRAVLAGALRANAGFHLAAGRRDLAPFGRDSSPALNLVWVTANPGTAAGLAASLRRSTAARWSPAVLTGSMAMSAFGLVYELPRPSTQD